MALTSWCSTPHQSTPGAPSIIQSRPSAMQMCALMPCTFCFLIRKFSGYENGVLFKDLLWEGP